MENILQKLIDETFKRYSIFSGIFYYNDHHVA